MEDTREQLKRDIFGALTNPRPTGHDGDQVALPQALIEAAYVSGGDDNLPSLENTKI